MGYDTVTLLIDLSVAIVKFNTLLFVTIIGDYVDMRDIGSNTTTAEELWSTDRKYKAVSLIAVQSLLNPENKAVAKPMEDHQLYENLRKDILSQVDVVAVWCLSSTVTNEVQYHIDYAELYR